MPNTTCNAGVFWQNVRIFIKRAQETKRVLGNGSEAANMAANLLYREPILITREDTLLTESSYVGHSLLAENL